MLRRIGDADRHYAQTLKLRRKPGSGEEIIVRDIDHKHVRTIIQSVQHRLQPMQGFEVYTVNADEIDMNEETQTS